MKVVQLIPVLALFVAVSANANPDNSLHFDTTHLPGVPEFSDYESDTNNSVSCAKAKMDYLVDHVSCYLEQDLGRGQDMVKTPLTVAKRYSQRAGGPEFEAVVEKRTPITSDQGNQLEKVDRLKVKVWFTMAHEKQDPTLCEFKKWNWRAMFEQTEQMIIENGETPEKKLGTCGASNCGSSGGYFQHLGMKHHWPVQKEKGTYVVRCSGNANLPHNWMPQ